LIDVTRLLWRAWRGRHPTGIDRVCLAYVRHFRDRGRAVVQRKGIIFVLSRTHSERVFDLLLQGREVRRAEIICALGRAIVSAWRAPPGKDMLYLNVGHTGLNDIALSNWIAQYSVRAIHLIHDLIPIANPEFCRPGEAERHRERILNALSSGTGIIGNSKATLEELASFAHERSTSVPPSVAAWIAGMEESREVIPKSLKRPFFVTVGTIEARKNHLMLLRIWRRLVEELREAAPVLVIVGQAGWEADEALQILNDPGTLENSVQTMQDCDDDELATWIAGARAVLMPSRAEGFGLPIIEALALGTPVIASDLPVFREIAGNIPLYLPPSDEKAWESYVRAFMSDNAERQGQVKRMASYRSPTWSEHFRIVEDWFSKL
jgi:glycosyltransferase involved in cell wall biosynthesis